MPSSFTVPFQVSVTACMIHGSVHHGCRRVSHHRCMFLHPSMRVTSVWHLEDLVESTGSTEQFVLNCFFVGQFFSYIKNSWFWECITLFQLLVFSGIPTSKNLIGQFSGENNEIRLSGQLSNPRRTTPEFYDFLFCFYTQYEVQIIWWPHDLFIAKPPHVFKDSVTYTNEP